MKLTKWKDNPILKPNADSDWEKMSVLNPAAWAEDGKVSLLYRASSESIDYSIYVGLAESRDGFHFERVGKEPVLSPSKDGFDAGCIEDPRVVKIDGTFYMAYAARAHPPHAHWAGRKRASLPSPSRTWAENITRSGIASSKDLRHWTRLGPCTADDLDNRDVMLFPEKINGRYVLIHRAIDDQGKYPQYKNPAIWLAFSEDMKNWGDDFMLAKAEVDWEKKRIGGGAPPIRTDAGWLMIYHAVGNFRDK